MKNFSSIIGIVVLVGLAYVFRAQLSALFSGAKPSGKVNLSTQVGTPSLPSTFGFPTGIQFGTSYGAQQAANSNLPAGFNNDVLGDGALFVPGITGSLPSVTYGQNQPIQWDPFANGNPGI